MTLPSLPSEGSTVWYSWAQAIHALATQVDTGGRLDDSFLRVAFVPFWRATESVSTGAVRVDSTGHLITANSSRTTRASYDATEQAAWTVVSGGGGGAITSVNSKTGVVVLSASDVGADASGAAATAQAASLQKSSNLSDVATPATARTNLGLGTAATQATSAFDAAGLAATAQAFAIQRANHTGTQAASTITGLATVATTGAYTDLTGKLAIGTTSTTAKAGNYTPSIADLPAGAKLSVRQNPGDSSWPARTSTRQDIYFDWLFSVAGSAAPTAATTPGTTTDGTYPGDAIFGA